MAKVLKKAVCWQLPLPIVLRLEAMAERHSLSRVEVARRCLAYGLSELEQASEEERPARVFLEDLEKENQ